MSGEKNHTANVPKGVTGISPKGFSCRISRQTFLPDCDIRNGR